MTDDAQPLQHAAIGRFRLAGSIPRDNTQTLAAWWRGAVAQRFPGDVAFHGHDGARTVARYPEVQYRWHDGSPQLFALGDAAQRVMAHPWPGATLRLGDQELRVAQVDWSSLALTRAFSRRLVRYEFRAPWIALNQQNHARFKDLARGERRAELDRILVGNILTMSQGLGWYFDDTVYAAVEVSREVPCVVKDTGLVGFEGTFVTNLDLPDHLALGRSVSHGFGWFTRA